MARVIHKDGRGNDAIYDSTTGAFIGFPSVLGDPNAPPSPVQVPDAQGPGTPTYDKLHNPDYVAPDRTLGGKLSDPSKLDPQANLSKESGPYNYGGGDAGFTGGGPNATMAATNPDKFKMIQMHLGALGAQAYRPELAQSRVNSLGNQLAAYGPMNNMLGAMYGPQAKMDLGGPMSQSPLTALQMGIGAPNKNDLGLAGPPTPNQQASVAPTSYPQNPVTSLAAYHVGPDGKIYDAQNKLVPQ